MHTDLPININNTCFLCTKPSVRNGRCEYSYVLGLLVYGKVVVVFSRKVFFVDCHVCKTFNMAKIGITELIKALTFTITQDCTHSRKQGRDVTSKCRNSAGSFTLYPFQS